MSVEPEVPVSVLFIESDETCRTMFIDMMGRNFPEIALDVADDVTHALQMLAHKAYDIIVCDAVLPKDQEVKLHYRLGHLIDSLIPVLIMTGHTDLKREDLPADLCISHILFKPLLLKEFLEIMGEAVSTIRVGGKPQCDPPLPG